MKMPIVVVSIVPVWLSLGLCLAQGSATAANKLPPGFIDGTKTPDLIPDGVAYRLVFMSLVPSPAGDAKAIAAQDAHMKFIGLQDADRAILQQVVATFGGEYSNWQRSTAGSANNSTTSTTQIDQIVQTALDSVITELSSKGSAKFIQYVTRAKSRMVVHP